MSEVEQLQERINLEELWNEVDTEIYNESFDRL